jgi:hypothetical protein
MGGVGSGRRWHFSAKNTTDAFRALDVRRWARDGLLEPGRAFGWQWTTSGEVTGSINVRSETGRVVLDYRSRNANEWQAQNYPVRLTATPCHLGGVRQWFLCPALGCGRRVAKLYGGAIFACRHCHQLAYPSQREGLSDRALRRAGGIRDKLGWQPGVANGYGPKPKGLHWRTFERLCAEHDDFERMSWAAFMARYGHVYPL